MSRNRPESLLKELETLRFAGDWFGHRAVAWPSALGDLLETPRALKFALNAVTKTWERLHGEVDIDELIILSALRYRAGAVFSFLVRRALDLRLLAGRSASNSDDKKDREEKERQLSDLRAEWKDAMSNTDANQFAVENLVGDLFPAAYLLTGRQRWLHSNRLQSVASRRGEIYMERITSGDLPREAVRDQSVLAHLHSVAAGKDLDLFAETFVPSREFAELAIFFDDAIRAWPTKPRISSDARLAAASAMLRVASDRQGDELLYSGNTYRWVTHWIGNASDDANYIEWAGNEVLQRIPYELFRATELYFDLFRDRHVLVEIQSKVREQILGRAKNVFTLMAPRIFAECFPAHFPYTLSHLIRLDTRSPGEPLHARLEDWTWLKPQILAGLAERPDILVPQVLPLFGTFGPQPGPFEHYKFDESAVSQFFGTDRTIFYERIAQSITPSDKLDSNFRRLLPLAAKEAQFILSGIGTDT